MNKQLIRDLLPPFAFRALSGLFYGWHGNYSSWEEAVAESTGYASENILAKVMESALKVRNGEAVYERDSMIFEEVQYGYPVLAALVWIALRNSGKLNVLDFGGSLGTTYYQNRFFLQDVKELNWCIVEQPDFVREGKKLFEDDHLHFFYNLEECIERYKIDVILLSSVLPYIEDPFGLIKKITELNIEFILVDRTPFVKGPSRITIQKVNPAIYKASYPCRFFNKDEFLLKFSDSYMLISEFDALDKANIASEFKGFLFRKR